ncbi:redox-regulated ATPase YchF [endosymbiont GvMRE of Glomus versiforme]|uniref:redox-regulated ATPase YchF n=1 Tax=endosymbiont GvMRE of Glomus versiforme TaxID=2039283 RepID=UPI000EDF6982|nr:redox-regulated ATPase YchF [endosymbiont GvMRE of Glomus versiforme]RHZ35585.1 Ribosome-binding ATPase YchF [endosymbiont GvMRE of Glomus versiforme]
MTIKIGLVGLPNVGKSSLFHFLTRKKEGTKIANYPFATIDPNHGVVLIPDFRLEKLGKYWQSEKITHSTVEIVDIAGLVKGASQGLGLGNEFLSHIREVDMIWHVLRCFPDQEIIHVEKSVNPIRDLEIIQLELISADLQQAERKLGKSKVKNEKTQKEKEICELIKKNLEQEIPVSQLGLSEEEKQIIKGYNFLTNKPVLLLANHGGNETEIAKLKDYAQQKQLTLFPLAIKLEKEMEEEMEKLSNEEKQELGWQSVDFSVLTGKIKQLLNLKTFFTVGEDETKSWLTKKAMNARECAGLIHSDIQKGFIWVEVHKYNDWLQFPGQKNWKGLTKKADYIIEDGDICHFLFRKKK